MSAQPYPMPVVTRARELREAGWSYRKVQHYVEQETGHRPSLNTICKWVDPQYRRAANSRNRKRHRQFSAGGSANGGRLGQSHHVRQYQEARARALAAMGVPYVHIARVMAFDYPDSNWNDDRVRKIAGPARRRTEVAA